jgi:hypothetical protein
VQRQNYPAGRHTPGGGFGEMTSLERLRTAGHPAPDLSPAQVVDVLCNSTVAHRPGYEVNGQVVRGNVELAVLTTLTLDLPTVRALDYVYIVGNVPQLYASTQRILARRAGYDLDFPDAEQTDKVGTCYIRYGERGAWRKVTFTHAQAEKAKLVDKDNWSKYGRDMLTARACTRAIGRYAPEVLAGMAAADVWPDDDDAQPDDHHGGAVAPSGATIPGPDREPPIDPKDRDDILGRVLDLPPPQLDWFRTRWRDDLGCPNLQRGWLSKAHGALARYMLADAEKAAAFAERLDGDGADAVPDDRGEPIPCDVHDDDESPEATAHDGDRFDPEPDPLDPEPEPPVTHDPFPADDEPAS